MHPQVIPSLPVASLLDLKLKIEDADCSFSQGNQFGVDVTVEVGLDLGLDLEDITGEAGISASVSVSKETASTQGVTNTCPDGPWTCSLIIYPPVTIVSGTQIPLSLECNKDPSAAQPYTVKFPEKVSDGLLVEDRTDICACKNFAHRANFGAPSIVCPQDCVA